MISKEKFKKCLPLVLVVIASQIGLMAYDPSRYNYDVTNKPPLVNQITTKLINNTKYGLWLRIDAPACIASFGVGCSDPDEDYDIFGTRWIPGNKTVELSSKTDVPEGSATLFYAMDPGLFTMGKMLPMNFNGKQSTAYDSPDISVKIHAEPVYMYYENPLLGNYIYEWYNYTITVDPKKTAEKTEM